VAERREGLLEGIPRGVISEEEAVEKLVAARYSREGALLIIETEKRKMEEEKGV